MLTLDLIKQAAERIAGRVHRTPVMTSRSFNEVAGCDVFFKCENLQRAGAFKARGATNKILSLSADEKKRGVLAVSSGNHAQAVALAAREAGVKAVVCIPDDAPKMKVAGMRSYGADIRVFDRHKDDRDAFGREIAEREGLVAVPAYDDYLIMAGQGTCGLEFVEEVPDLERGQRLGEALLAEILMLPSIDRRRFCRVGCSVRNGTAPMRQISPHADRANGVDIAVSGDSQTIVYAAKPRKTQNQGLALCEILLPNHS